MKPSTRPTLSAKATHSAPVRHSRTRTFQPTTPVNELLALGEELAGLTVTEQINQTLALYLPALLAQRAEERKQRSGALSARLNHLAKLQPVAP